VTTGTAVRPAAPADAEAVARIYAPYVTGSVVSFEEAPPGPAEIARRMADVTECGLPYLVAEAAGAVVGFGYCAPYRPRAAYRFAVEDSVYVAPAARGRGAGRALLEELLARCAEAGVRQVIAVIADSGDPASVALHRRLGFVDAGRLTAVGFKHGRWIDTIRLQRTLSGGEDAVAPVPLRLDHSVVAVSDWDVSNRFYRDVLGAELVPAGGPRVAYRLGDAQLNVHGPGVDLAENVARLPVRPGGSDLCFVWPGRIAEAVGHLERHGVAVETGPVRRLGARGQGTSVYFRDPDGSLLELISYAEDGGG
jgi:L-amino acid N-acyltransferase YncA/catechol 2,3-dioxygenase-like lactoylglutathione lyase family enzyme